MLGLKETLTMIYKHSENLVNKESELISTCRLLNKCLFQCAKKKKR